MLFWDLVSASVVADLRAHDETPSCAGRFRAEGAAPAMATCATDGRALLDRFLGRRHRVDVPVDPSSHEPTHTQHVPNSTRVPRASTATRVRLSPLARFGTRRDTPKRHERCRRHFTSFVDSPTRMSSLYRSIAFAHHGYRHFLADAPSTRTRPAPRARARGCECVVTGANRGLGLEVARALVSRGATVHCVCRNHERGMMAMDALREDAARGGGTVKTHAVDLSSLAQIALRGAIRASGTRCTRWCVTRGDATRTRGHERGV